MAGRRLIHAATIADCHGVVAPGAILLNGHTIEAVGSPSSIGEVGDAKRETYSSGVVMPGLVNAHCHLDLSELGPIPCDKGFEAWLNEIRLRRPTDTKSIEASAQRGIELALAGGTAAVGDIGGAGSWASHAALEASPLRGTVWIEVFGIGAGESKGVGAVEEIQKRAATKGPERIAVGVSPHAPYSCGPGVYQAAAASGLPVATHLAETLDELAFCLDRTGPCRALLEQLGLYTEAVVALGEHPFCAFAELMSPTWTLAHVNYPPKKIEPLAATGATVAYCPRASAFFGHINHPWREYLQSGVPVALGTDSLCCLDTPERISVIDEMRWLVKHDDAVLEELLPMATTNGALAVGIDPAIVNLQPGPVAGVIHAELDRSHGGGLEWILRPEQNDPVHVSGRKEIKLRGRYNPMS